MKIITLFKIFEDGFVCVLSVNKCSEFGIFYFFSFLLLFYSKYLKHYLRYDSVILT